jgi:hypothetical protein
MNNHYCTKIGTVIEVVGEEFFIYLLCEVFGDKYSKRKSDAVSKKLYSENISFTKDEIERFRQEWKKWQE